jgi:SAM-dependent methyltransferase
MLDDKQQAALGHVNRAWDWFAGMVALSATNLGVELGMFDLLKSAGPLTPAEIAARLALVPRAVDVWAKTLVHYELLLNTGEGKVTMAPGLDLMVCEPVTLFNLAPSLQFHARFVARDFLDLADFFRDGILRPPVRHGAALSENVARQTSMMHAAFVESILPAMPEVLELLLRGCRVLDAGCGDGDLGVLLCSEFPFTNYTGYDIDPQAIQAGRATAEMRGFAARLKLVLGDVVELTAGAPAFDLAFLFLTLHEIPPGDRAAVAAATRAALRPGGALLVLDESYPETLAEAARRESRMGLHFEYTELVWGSHAPTRTEVHELLSGAGFTGVERLAMLGGSFEVVVARTRMTTGRKLEGELLTECAEWIWEQLQDDGYQIAGELVDLILATERELGVQARDLPEIAQVLEDEFRMRGISGSPLEITAPLILSVIEWEDDFLGFAGIYRADS